MIRLVTVLLLFLSACGLEDTNSHEHPDTPPAVVTPPLAGGLTWAANVKPITDRKCAGCHPNADFVLSESGYTNNQSVKNKLVNRLMPPPTASQQLTDAERKILLDESFFF